MATAKNILIVGDSLSAAHHITAESSWVNLLQQRLNTLPEKYHVINASISGETTAGGLARLPGLLKKHVVHIVILELGGNDGLRGTPLNIIYDNLKKMIELIQDDGNKLLLIGMHIPINYGPSYRKQFNHIYSKLAEEHRTSLVPFMLDGIAKVPTLMQEDGVHPNEDAQPKILDNIWPHLEPLLLKD